MNKREKHPLAGKTVTLNLKRKHPQIKTGDHYRIEDWWENVNGQSWKFCKGNPACLIYAMSSGFSDIPTDDEVVYGKVDGLGHLIHASELGDEVSPKQ